MGRDGRAAPGGRRGAHRSASRSHLGATAALARLAVLIGPFAVFPFVTNEGNLFRYGLITIVYASLPSG